jgi:1,4-dihydroxy-2-naphthoate polyprenyltransferase
VTNQRPGGLVPWIMASRPKTLPAAATPVVMGIALAVNDSVLVTIPALAALLSAILLQIGANLANDYFDFVKGADTQDRLGPTRAAASGLISLPALRLGMVGIFGLAAAIGLYLIHIGGWPILVVGLAAILAAVAYTGGPLPYGYHGLGDVFVFLFFGFIAVSGTYYVQALRISSEVLWASIPAGTLVTAILVVNNLRDIETDRRAGKNTLAVYLGRRGTRMEYTLLLTVAYLVPLGLWMFSGWSPWTLLAWLTLPLALKLAMSVWKSGTGPELNAVLAGTARLGLLYGLLFSAGLIL